MAQKMQTDKGSINLMFSGSRPTPIEAYDKVLNAEYPDPRRGRAMNHGVSLSMFPLAAAKDLKLLQRPDLIEQILIKFDYIDNFNKNKKELPDVPVEDLENIEELLEDDVSMELGKSSLARKLHTTASKNQAPAKTPGCQANHVDRSGRQRPTGTIAPHGHMQITGQPGGGPSSRCLDRIKAFCCEKLKSGASRRVWVQPLTLLKTGRLDVLRKEAREILM
ncbi:hypothetical protein JB92DRAFT_2826784 [Gautieria morchelliformis]|nr:hypothetical protein JB92DRAFT_2826784 [Gautieria morchelliformis]